MGAQFRLASAHEVVLLYFSQSLDANVPDLFNGRIAARHHFSDAQAPWSKDTLGMTIRPDGGNPSIYVQENLARVEFAIYGKVLKEAEAASQTILYFIRNFQRTTVVVEDGTALFQNIVLETMPSQQYDPDIGLSYILFYATATVAEALM